MSTPNLNLALAYYEALNTKNLAQAEKFLHPDVVLLSPLAEVIGKSAAVEAAKGLITVIKGITIRAQFASQDQVMLALDIEFPAPIGLLRSAVLITFKEGLIVHNELFYDARLVQQKKEEIFSTSDAPNRS